jgi:hypothetical protein
MKLIFLLTALAITLSIPAIANVPTYNFNDYYQYGKEATKLAQRVKRFSVKYKYPLEYKTDMDLVETCGMLCKYSKYSHFDKYELTTTVLKESRFNPKAFNKKDGGIGLGQLTKIKTWHKDTLFWMTKPFDKDQNIKGMIFVLEDNLRTYKQKAKAIQTYNGFHYRSIVYRNDFYRIKERLKSV